MVCESSEGREVSWSRHGRGAPRPMAGRACRLAALFTALLAAALACPGPAAAERQSGIQVTPDGLQVLISKDRSGDRWAISRHLFDETVTGNVYPLDGGAPQFVWCEEIEATATDLTLDCSVAAPCLAAPCEEQWTSVGEVTLPLSFFEPPSALAPSSARPAGRARVGRDDGAGW